MSKAFWIIVADSAHARFFSAGHHATHLSEARPHITSTTHPHGREGHHDPQKMGKHDFIASLAEILDNAANANAFDALILVAPKRSLGEFRPLLSERVRDRIIAEVPKDLTKHPADELWKHLETLIRRENAGLPPP